MFIISNVLLQFSWRRGSKDSRGKDSSVCFLKTLSAPLTFFRFLRCLFLVYPIHFFQLNLNPLAILEGIDITDLLICEVRPYLSSFGNFAVILYISKQSSYDFCQTFKSL